MASDNVPASYSAADSTHLNLLGAGFDTGYLTAVAVLEPFPRDATASAHHCLNRTDSRLEQIAEHVDS